MKQFDMFGGREDIDEDKKYTKKVPTPVYEIKGEKPNI